MSIVEYKSLQIILANILIKTVVIIAKIKTIEK